jgi:hypothetical protein
MKRFCEQFQAQLGCHTAAGLCIFKARHGIKFE